MPTIRWWVLLLVWIYLSCWDGLSRGEAHPVHRTVENVDGGIKNVSQLENWKPQFLCRNGTLQKDKLEDAGNIVFETTASTIDCTESKVTHMLRNDATIVSTCISGTTVAVAVQPQGTLDRRVFWLTCDPSSTLATLQNTTDYTVLPEKVTGEYPEGLIRLLVVDSTDLHLHRLTNTPHVTMAQDNVFLLIHHKLTGPGSHVTMFPERCVAASASHPHQLLLWDSRVQEECFSQEALLSHWEVRPWTSSTEDTTIAKLFPFQFRQNEAVNISCSVRECPDVADPKEFSGECRRAYDKYRSCGGVYRTTAA